MFSDKEEEFYVWATKGENHVSGVFPNVRRLLSFAVESQDVVTAAVALGVPELDAETSAEIDGQLFIVLSAVTDGESFDVVTSAGGDRGFESWRKLRKRWEPYTAGRARSLLREILSPPRAKLPELMGAIERTEDLVRRCCGGRDAQGHPHNLADDIRMSSLEALLQDDLEKHAQLNRARLTSYVVLREEIKTCCECGGHAHARNKKDERPVTSRKEMTQWTLVRSANVRASTARAKGKGKQGQQGEQDKNKDRDHNKDSIECWNCGKRGHYSKDCWSKKDQTSKGGSRGKKKNKNGQRTLTILSRGNQQTLNQKSKSVDST